MADELDISDVSKLRTRGGRKVLQAHRGAHGIAYEDEGGWCVVSHDGSFAMDKRERSYDLLRVEPDPWEGVILPQLRLEAYQGIWVVRDISKFRPGIDELPPRRFRLVPIEEPQQ